MFSYLVYSRVEVVFISAFGRPFRVCFIWMNGVIFKFKGKTIIILGLLLYAS